jgi:molecular chaperone GrpE
MTDERNRDETDEGDAAAAREPGRGSLTVEEHGEGTDAPVVTEVGELRAELEALNDRHLRLAAEFDNYRKRNERERQTLAVRLQSDLVASLLDVLDDLRRVEGETSATSEALLEGVRLVEKKFGSILESAGLEPIETEGKPFDPAVMEALMTVPTEDPAQDGVVADVLQPGYLFRDVLLRPARVRVLQYQDPAGEGE